MKKHVGSLVAASFVLSSALSPAPASASDPLVWTLVAPPKLWHIRHSLTVLDSGDVLAVGHEGDDPFAAEVYDHASGQWALTGPRMFRRHSHAAVKLPGGRGVLLCGGREAGVNGPDGPTVTVAEIYDEASGSFWTTGAMVSPRTAHTATGFTDIRGEEVVLVAGGFSKEMQGFKGVVERSAEIYDAATGQWAAAEPMLEGRALHSATWLEGRGVLIAGGVPSEEQGDSLASVEIWDLVTRKWQSVSPMSTPRFGHTATLLSNRKILVTGGLRGRSDQVLLDGAELYDPEQDVWTEVLPMKMKRTGHAAVLLPDDRVLITGGLVPDGSGTVQSTGAEVFDARSSQWYPFPSMMTRREGHSAVSLGDAVLVLGGPRLVSAELLSLRRSGEPCAQGVECRSGFCAGQVCCDDPCGSPCATCLAAEGAPRDGTCFERSCAPFFCSRSDRGPVCMESCSSDNDCALGYACDPPSRTCVEPRSTFVSEGCALAGPVAPPGGRSTWWLLWPALLGVFALRRTGARRALGVLAPLLLFVGAGCDGAGDVSLCGPLLTACVDRCVDTSMDRLNCGACGDRCELDELCIGGECGLACAGGTTLCDDRCVDLRVDPESCGACGAACAEGWICQDGSCALPAGLRSYIFPGVTASGGAHAREPDFVLMADAPATLHYTTDGSSPVPGEQGTVSARSPVKIAGVESGVATQRWIRWFAEYDLFGPEVEVRSYLSVIDPVLQDDFDAVVPAPRLGPEGWPLLVVSSGDVVAGEIDYAVWRSKPGGYCPGCKVQLVAGLEGDGAVVVGCASSAKFSTYPGSQGTFTFERPVAVPPGRYAFRWWLDLNTGCAPASEAVTPKSEDIGLLIVR